MQINNSKISGVLHLQSSQKNYRLRRYQPIEELAELVEQFWFVNWDLPAGKNHTQQNLPDPNMHLILERSGWSLLGPVSKRYSYKMEQQGQIVGVKFQIGALHHLLQQQISELVDQRFKPQSVLGKALELPNQSVCVEKSDEQIVALLNPLLLSLKTPLQSEAVHLLREMVEAIKSNSAITTVAVLAQQYHLSVRATQRLFRQYLGITPKAIIQKYRLHQALELLDSGEKSVIDVVVWLGYVDQSHLIRDFKQVLGKTPGAYLSG